jgi:hypothetical protein
MRFFCRIPSPIVHSLCYSASVHLSRVRCPVLPCILAPQWLSQAQYTGSLIIKRDSGFMGSACTIRVFVGAVPERVLNLL